MSTTSQDKDQILWMMAQKRARFKKHLFTYLIINIFLWIIWFLTDAPPGHIPEVASIRNIVDAWPIWVTVGWGIGLAFSYFDAYQGTKDYLAQKEYDKLVKQGMKR